jgi:hypothetical protein
MSNFLFLLSRCVEKSNLAEIPYTFEGHEEAQVRDIQKCIMYYVLRYTITVDVIAKKLLSARKSLVAALEYHVTSLR